MSFDIPPLHIPDNSPEARAIQAIISRDRVTPEEAVRSVLRGAAMQLPKSKPKTPANRRDPRGVKPISEAELAKLDKLCPALQMLDDVTDEQWDRIAKVAREMGKAGYLQRD